MDDVTYNHECDNIVQHVCEELYHVPVPLKPAPIPLPPPPAPFPVTPKPIFLPTSESRTPRSSASPSVSFRSESPSVSFRSRPSLPPRYKRQSQSNDPDLDTEKLVTGLHTAVKAPAPTILSHQGELK